MIAHDHIANQRNVVLKAIVIEAVQKRDDKGRAGEDRKEVVDIGRDVVDMTCLAIAGHDAPSIVKNNKLQCAFWMRNRQLLSFSLGQLYLIVRIGEDTLVGKRQYA